MNFREFLLLFEDKVQWGYTGSMNRILGSGEPGTLHYGTAEGFPKPMLYVPLPKSLVRPFRERVRTKIKFDCVLTRHETLDCRPKEGATPELQWSGEAHMTVAMGDELQKALVKTGMPPIEALKRTTIQDPQRADEVPLFDERGHGMACPVSATQHEDKFFKLVPTALFADQPLALILFVRSPCYVEVRNSLGLTDYPKLPPHLGPYIPHATIGYLFKKDIDVSGWTIHITRGKGIDPATARATRTYKQRTAG